MSLSMVIRRHPHYSFPNLVLAPSRVAAEDSSRCSVGALIAICNDAPPPASATAGPSRVPFAATMIGARTGETRPRSGRSVSREGVAWAPLLGSEKVRFPHQNKRAFVLELGHSV